MNMTKRLLAVTLLLTMAVCLVACGGGEEIKDPTTTAPTTAPTTTAPTTVPTTNTTAPTVEYTYRVRVVDQKGEPIVGAWVQLCLETCDSAETNAEGWALFNSPVANGYKARIVSLPEGYEDYIYVTEDIFFAPGLTEIVLTARPGK